MEMAAEQPISTEIRMADGVFVKTMVVRKKGTVIPQHSHKFSHTSCLVRGSVRLFANSGTPDVDYMGIYIAPCGIVIEAGVKHLFETITDDVIVIGKRPTNRPS